MSETSYYLSIVDHCRWPFGLYQAFQSSSSTEKLTSLIVVLYHLSGRSSNLFNRTIDYVSLANYVSLSSVPIMDDKVSSHFL